MEVKRVPDAARYLREKMQKVGLFDSERMLCDLYCLLPGQEQRPHQHPECDKVYVVLEGKGLFRIAGEEQELEVHESTIARAGQEHSVRNQTQEKLLLLVFMAPKPF